MESKTTEINLKKYEKEIIHKYIQGNILDLGCGTGRIYPVLKNKGCYYGIDCVQESIQIANKNYPNSNFFNMDIQNLKFKNNFFDVVFAGFNVIDEVDDIHRSLSEIQRVLKPEGLFIFSMHNRYYWRHLFRKHPIQRSGKTIIPRTQSIQQMKLLCKKYFSIHKIYGGILTPYPYFICKK